MKLTEVMFNFKTSPMYKMIPRLNVLFTQSMPKYPRAVPHTGGEVKMLHQGAILRWSWNTQHTSNVTITGKFRHNDVTMNQFSTMTSPTLIKTSYIHPSEGTYIFPVFPWPNRYCFLTISEITSCYQVKIDVGFKPENVKVLKFRPRRHRSVYNLTGRSVMAGV